MRRVGSTMYEFEEMHLCSEISFADINKMCDKLKSNDLKLAKNKTLSDEDKDVLWLSKKNLRGDD